MNLKQKGILGIIIILLSISSGLIGYNLVDRSVSDQNLYIRSFIDSKNRNVTVPWHPLRIVSMAPSVTEILFALGVEDRLVGVTDFCNYPEEATLIDSIGGYSTPDLEKLAILNPDLIISSRWDVDAVSTLENSGYTIAIFEDSNFTEIIENIREIGEIVDAEISALSIVNSMYERLWTVANKTQSLQQSKILRIYFEVWETPTIAGKNSYLNDMIELAGATNIFNNVIDTYADVSYEDVINGNPQAIFITEHSATWYSQTICDRTGYNVLDACVNNRIYSVNDDIYLRTGPRIIDALENMTNYLHPGLL